MYQEFAGIYDHMMSEIPYDEWFEKLHACLGEKGKSSGHLCELGCGTGEMSIRFAKAGYEVTGIDLSPDMLAIAQQKNTEEDRVLYLNQDMTDFSLHKLADVVLCICDSANYLLEDQELASMFACVQEVLAPQGVFVFDLKTEHCFSEILGDGIRLEDQENYTVIWDNQYDAKEQINEYLLTMFVRCGETNEYQRFDECHRQRAYDISLVNRLLKEAGFKQVACYDSAMRTKWEHELGDVLCRQEERVYFVVQKE